MTTYTECLCKPRSAILKAYDNLFGHRNATLSGQLLALFTTHILIGKHQNNEVLSLWILMELIHNHLIHYSKVYTLGNPMQASTNLK